MRNFIIAKDAFAYIFILVIISVGLYLIYPPLAFITILQCAFVLFFFRNPPRRIPTTENIIVSPADGKVLSITEIDEPDFLKSKGVKVTIFLSLFNVHINRSPISGVVQYVHYRPGKYLPAFKSHASDINERNTIGIEGNGIRVLVHQITGFVARRIVCWVGKGDQLTMGGRFGLIKFGSCTEIIMPTHVDLKVKPGDRVKGAKTVIGVIK